MSRVREDLRTLIISAWPKVAFQANLPFGYYEMPPAPKCNTHGTAPCRVCKPVSLLMVGQVLEAIDRGDDVHDTKIVDDRELAVSLVELGNVAKYGVVVCAAVTPTREEVEQAYASLDVYLRGTLESEDSYRAAKGHALNPEHAAIAVQYFGVERPWSQDLKPKEPCPACATFNPVSIAKCGNVSCGAILNWERARELGMLTDRQEEGAIARGQLSGMKTKAPVAARA